MSRGVILRPSPVEIAHYARKRAGRSAFTEPFALFGEDLARYDDLFTEKLDLLLRIRDEDPITWTGTVRPALRSAHVIPRTTRQLPVWVALGGTPASAERAERLGLPMMLGLLGGTFDNAKRLVDTYRRAGAAAGHNPDTLSVGATGHFYVGETPHSSRDEFFPYYQRYVSPDTNNGRGWHVDRDGLDHASARGNALFVGDLREIVENLLDLRATLGIDRFLGQVDLVGLPPDLVRGSITRFGDIIAPAIRHALTYSRQQKWTHPCSSPTGSSPDCSPWSSSPPAS